MHIARVEDTRFTELSNEYLSYHHLRLIKPFLLELMSFLAS